jgi:hypothetical protein
VRWSDLVSCLGATRGESNVDGDDRDEVVGVLAATLTTGCDVIVRYALPALLLLNVSSWMCHHLLFWEGKRVGPARRVRARGMRDDTSIEKVGHGVRKLERICYLGCPRPCVKSKQQNGSKPSCFSK